MVESGRTATLVLAVLFFSVHLVIGVWDFIAVQVQRPQDTVSFVTRDWGQRNLILVLFVGVVLGHVLGPVRQYPAQESRPVSVVEASASEAGSPSAVRSFLLLTPWIPVAVGAFLIGWLMLWRLYGGNSHS